MNQIRREYCWQAFERERENRFTSERSVKNDLTLLCSIGSTILLNSRQNHPSYPPATKYTMCDPETYQASHLCWSFLSSFLILNQNHPSVSILLLLSFSCLSFSFLACQRPAFCSSRAPLRRSSFLPVSFPVSPFHDACIGIAQVAALTNAVPITWRTAFTFWPDGSKEGSLGVLTLQSFPSLTSHL